MNEKGKMILAEDQEYSLDCYKTQLNNNVLVVGASGAGKTRSIVTPNILEATGSYIISDPKGNLHNKYTKYLKEKGYIVKRLDFVKPEISCRYNPFAYIKNTQDIIKVAHMLIYQDEHVSRRIDPFWDQAAQLLLQALISYICEFYSEKDMTLTNLIKLVTMCSAEGELEHVKSPVDLLFDEVRKTGVYSYALETYDAFRVAADRTLRSIMITVNAKLALFNTPDLIEMTKFDAMDISSIGDKKTAVFVVVSDTDRSMDPLANLFYTQAMNELCLHADYECTDNCLTVPVRFILDDFATNCKIESFPRMIASIRSRGISTMLMIQAESQLNACYGEDGSTIIANCDTYVYMGGNDVNTSIQIAKRCDVPLKRILQMPIGTNWIFRRGQAPVNSKNFDLEQYMKKKKIQER